MQNSRMPTLILLTLSRYFVEGLHEMQHKGNWAESCIYKKNLRLCQLYARFTSHRT